jgi:hypothetical protein
MIPHENQLYPSLMKTVVLFFFLVAAAGATAQLPQVPLAGTKETPVPREWKETPVPREWKTPAGMAPLPAADSSVRAVRQRYREGKPIGGPVAEGSGGIGQLWVCLDPGAAWAAPLRADRPEVAEGTVRELLDRFRLRAEWYRPDENGSGMLLLVAGAGEAVEAARLLSEQPGIRWVEVVAPGP